MRLIFILSLSLSLSLFRFRYKLLPSLKIVENFREKFRQRFISPMNDSSKDEFLPLRGFLQFPIFSAVAAAVVFFPDGANLVPEI